MPALGGLILRYREGIDAMARAPLKLQLRKNQLHKALGKGTWCIAQNAGVRAQGDGARPFKTIARRLVRGITPENRH